MIGTIADSILETPSGGARDAASPPSLGQVNVLLQPPLLNHDGREEGSIPADPPSVGHDGRREDNRVQGLGHRALTRQDAEAIDAALLECDQELEKRLLGTAPTRGMRNEADPHP